MSLIDHVLENEGFRSKPYQDTLGVLTIGHGLTWISEEESKVIVEGRLNTLYAQIKTVYTFLSYEPEHKAVLDVTTEMAFQMGFAGLQKFKKMWLALDNDDYATAATEMLDSKWAKQTPNRAIKLSDLIRGLA